MMRELATMIVRLFGTNIMMAICSVSLSSKSFSSNIGVGCWVLQYV